MKNLLMAWNRLTIYVQIAIGFGLICLIVLIGLIFYHLNQMLLDAFKSATDTILSFDPVKSFYTMASVLITVFIVQPIFRVFTTHAEQVKIARVEERLRENPDKPQLAWDLARTKLENYLDRNLGQLRSIFWLTAFVMMVGFGFVLYGVNGAFKEPGKWKIAIVGSASGLIISFIGGSFLIIYRYILTQTRRYVSVLERINAVGMAVQVLGSISDDNKELRNQSTAKLASQLINLYSTSYLIDEAEDQSLTREEPPRKPRKKVVDPSVKKD